MSGAIPPTARVVLGQAYTDMSGPYSFDVYLSSSAVVTPNGLIDPADVITPGLAVSANSNTTDVRLPIIGAAPATLYCKSGGRVHFYVTGYEL